jgi:Domain of unknown function (DUF4136)
MARRRASVDVHAMTLEKLPRLVFCAAMLAGCASDPIEVSGDPAALPSFKTFNVYQQQFAFATEISDEQREHVSKELRAAVVHALEGRGYREASNADVLVALGAVSRLTLSDDPGAGGGPLHHVDTSVLDPGRPTVESTSELLPEGVGREGDLFLDLLDAKTQRVVWHASSTGAATTPSEALRKARSTYAAMVGRLPKATR